jgi:cystathionine beta-lyase/cystathionine gamma-synthase
MAADESPLHFETIAAQAGLRMRVGDTISTSPAIDPSTTFTYETVSDVHAALEPEGSGFAYSRNANPTVVALEDAIAPLEAAEEVVAFGSGMGAIQATLSGLQLWPGDVILSSGDLYGVTRGLLTQLGQYEIETRFVDVFNLDAVSDALRGTRARVLYFETISNPLLRVPPAADLIQLAREHGAACIVDNTFASPYLCRPLELGADVVVESASKYIAGHGDVISGLVATSRSLGRRIRDARTFAGGVLSPFDAWLTMRGVRTLPLRVERQCATALWLARALCERAWIRTVHYPGLPGHPQHELAARQFGDRYGGMLALELAADRGSTVQFMDSLRLITPGTSLGDVESLVLYPALSSHRTLSTDELARAGIGEGLVRLSVGIEHPEDLLADLDRAARESALPGT